MIEVIIIILLIVFFVMLCRHNEDFWGGYFPVPYHNQYVPRYGHVAVNAATEEPQILVDPSAFYVNP